LFDLLFALVALAAIAGGYRAGFTTRVLSWIGLGVGLAAGLRLVPWVLDHIDGARYEVVVAATIGIVVLLVVIGETVGLAVGRRFAPRAPRPSQLDHVLGGVAGFVAVSMTVWMVLPVLVASTGWPGELVADSAVARLIADRLPAPPDVEVALRRLVGRDTFPSVFDTLQPRVTTPAPVTTGLDSATTARIARSVVKIDGVACRVTKLGTGFTVGDALVVTNAHVVAGEATTSVERDDGKRLSATVVAFDPNRDLALLAVSGLGRDALPVGGSNGGNTGAVFGHPGGGQLRVAPFEVARKVEALGKDIYGTGPVRREVLELAADLQPGDSGAALVEAAGDVVGVAFAKSTQQAGVGYALATSELEAILQAPHDRAVNTGPCTD
jgi:S1-C subfamily serine protease